MGEQEYLQFAQKVTLGFDNKKIRNSKFDLMCMAKNMEVSEADGGEELAAIEEQYNLELKESPVKWKREVRLELESDGSIL
jgi:hypothetical protein